MAKTKTAPASNATSPSVKEQAASQKPARREGLRETIESVVIAFALAFLFRTFEAEAFVIPTGSMAPTLMGRHKDLTCEKCDFPYRVSASDEVDARTGHRLPTQMAFSTCPMCRYSMSLVAKHPEAENYYSYNGDRIIASKVAYDVGDPRRWDVVVFKCPEEAQTNFIKRLVGLPGETVAIHRGNIYARADGEEELTIQRRPPRVLWEMLHEVYDNDYVLDELVTAGWPLRWQATSPRGESGAWQTSEDYRTFTTDGSAGQETWIGYQHIVPPAWKDSDDLVAISNVAELTRPQLIVDFTSYNTSRTMGQRWFPDPDSLGLHWVGDLVLECELSSEIGQGVAILKLIEGGRALRCEIDLATGQATLLIDGLASFAPRAKTSVRGPGRHRVAFANVDDQLLLWVDGKLVKFDAPTTYPNLGNHRPTVEDLTPARIGSRGAALKVSHVRLLRDVYYIAASTQDERGYNPISDIPKSRFPQLFHDAGDGTWTEFLSNPDLWDVYAELVPVQFKLGPDEFFFLGDNSPRSRDSRLWSDGHAVERDLLLGKALFVYWPHAWETPVHGTLPVMGRELRVPFYPNFRRMGFIR